MLPYYQKGIQYASYLRMKKQRYPVSSLVLLAVVSICVFVVILFSIPHLLGYDDAEKSNISDSEPMILREESFDETNREESVEKSIDDSPPLQSDTLVWSIGFLGTMLLTMVLGMMFGFLGSIPIAGPTSAMILKFGIQGKYRAGQAVAVGGATAEAMYAGVAFWGFGSFLSHVDFLLPFSKVFGAVVLLAMGVYFLVNQPKPNLDSDSKSKSKLKMRAEFSQNELMKHLLLGLTMSGINPALLASYTGAIATVYGTGWLEFTSFLALVFAVGVASGISSWFFILLLLLKKYKEKLKPKIISQFLRGMGIFLICCGLMMTHSAWTLFTSRSEADSTILDEN